jgi:hypothetical protein
MKLLKTAEELRAANRTAQRRFYNRRKEIAQLFGHFPISENEFIQKISERVMEDRQPKRVVRLGPLARLGTGERNHPLSFRIFWISTCSSFARRAVWGRRARRSRTPATSRSSLDTHAADHTLLSISTTPLSEVFSLAPTSQEPAHVPGKVSKLLFRARQKCRTSPNTQKIHPS